MISQQDVATNIYQIK